MDYDQITISAFLYLIILCDSNYLIIFFYLPWRGGQPLPSIHTEIKIAIIYK